jgi:hypothetical protein
VNYSPEITEENLSNEENHLSLVERAFDKPDIICQGEYTAMYEFLLNPDICDDPGAIVGALNEFSGWAQHMLAQMQKLGFIGRA